jgi:predicted nucleic acid-binding protein
MNIVVDTNVLVSACIGNGPASRLLEACLAGKASPVIGASLLLEYLDVLNREDLFKTARLSPEERQLLLRAFVSCCQW